MKRLSLLLDDIAVMRSAFNDATFDPVRFSVISEIEGANGLVYTFRESNQSLCERDARSIKEVRKTFFNLRIPVEDRSLHLALSLMPDMVTLVDLKSAELKTATPIDVSLHLEEIENMLSDFQANHISVSVLIQPQINILKNISKLSVDYVELDVTEFTAAQDINEEMLALDKIKSAAVAAGKLGLGVNCSGGIGYEHLSTLVQIPNMEDIVVGRPLIQRALWLGIGRAVKDALDLIRHREID